MKKSQKKRFIGTNPDIARLYAVSPGLPHKYDPRIQIPFKGGLNNLELLIGLVVDPYLQWKDSKQRLYAVLAVLGDEGRTLRTANRAARRLITNSQAIYFENGWLQWLSYFELPTTNLIATQWFVPPNKEVFGDFQSPPYDPHSAVNFTHPTQLEDLGPFIDYQLKLAYGLGINNDLRERIKTDLTRNAMLVTLFAEVHRELYFI